MTQFYCQEHFYTYWGVDIFSRHVSVKQYKCWIGYIIEWLMASMVSVKSAQELLELVVTSAVLYSICQMDDIRSQLKECETIQ